MSAENITTMRFEDDGSIPNNADLPLILYRAVLPDDHDPVAACRRLFEQNKWGGMWVNGVFGYHHYHSTAHEVLGVVGGNADLQFGGEQGEVVSVRAGDVVIIPAGVGHKRVSASPDFSVVGAYPQGQSWDLCTGMPDERPQVLENIASVQMPERDPVQGRDGFLQEAWRAQK